MRLNAGGSALFLVYQHRAMLGCQSIS